jgi:hypothetical protein
MEVKGQLHSPVTLHLKKETLVPLDRRLGGSQSQSDHDGKEENPTPACSQTLVVQPIA